MYTIYTSFFLLIIHTTIRSNNNITYIYNRLNLYYPSIYILPIYTYMSLNILLSMYVVAVCISTAGTAEAVA